MEFVKSERLRKLPPYLFAEIDRKKKAAIAAGRDVINLGVGDPDRPTPPSIIKSLQHHVENPAFHQYALDQGAPELRRSIAAFCKARYGLDLDPESEILPLIGSKEGLAHFPLAVLNPGDISLVPDPCYPVYRSSSMFAGADVYTMPLEPRLGFRPDLDVIPADVYARARLMFLNYPNNPTGAVVPEGLFADVVALARGHDLLAVHDNAYSETTYDGYVAPSFLSTPGAKDVGVEVFSLSKGYNMTGWRCAAIVGNAEAIAHFWQLKSNVDSGLFEAVQLAGVAALQPAVDAEVAAMNAVYARRRDLVCDALAQSGVNVTRPKGTIYVWAPIPEGFESSAAYCEHVLERAAVVVSPGGAYGRSGEGFFRISLTTPDDRLLEAVERLRSL